MVQKMEMIMCVCVSVCMYVFVSVCISLSLNLSHSLSLSHLSAAALSNAFFTPSLAIPALVLLPLQGEGDEDGAAVVVTVLLRLWDEFETVRGAEADRTGRAFYGEKL